MNVARLIFSFIAEWNGWRGRGGWGDPDSSDGAASALRGWILGSPQAHSTVSLARISICWRLGYLPWHSSYFISYPGQSRFNTSLCRSTSWYCRTTLVIHTTQATQRLTTFRSSLQATLWRAHRWRIQHIVPCVSTTQTTGIVWLVNFPE